MLLQEQQQRRTFYLFSSNDSTQCLNVVSLYEYTRNSTVKKRSPCYESRKEETSQR
jgi:hypothetical protein